MTSKEALRELVLKYNVPQNVLEPLRLLDKRDTPVKPFVNVLNGVTEYNCGVCVCMLDIPQLKELNFCPKCGQRLDWSE